MTKRRKPAKKRPMTAQRRAVIKAALESQQPMRAVRERYRCSFDIVRDLMRELQDEGKREVTRRDMGAVIAADVRRKRGAWCLLEPEVLVPARVQLQRRLMGLDPMTGAPA